MKKRDIKLIKEVAKKLPPSKEIQKYFVIINGMKQYKFRFVDIDHLNRLKSAYSRNKETGMQNYVNWLYANNEKINQMMSK